ILTNIQIHRDQPNKFTQPNMLHLNPPINPNRNHASPQLKYIYNQYHLNAPQAYKTTLQKHIHKFTNTPDFNHHNFS
ncbi:phage portal protein, partial [Staphylococcus epidermidis]|uniref:phage portal protein n=1 Tax=Staphylococcus epidermidis TaxID=1282 RepID=UPI0011A49185